jgi:hypothetical protein
MGLGFLNGFWSNSSKDSKFVLLLYIVMKPQHLQYLLLVAGLLEIVQVFAGAIVSEWRVGGVGVWVEMRHARLREALGRTG